MPRCLTWTRETCNLDGPRHFEEQKGSRYYVDDVLVDADFREERGWTQLRSRCTSSKKHSHYIDEDLLARTTDQNFDKLDDFIFRAYFDYGST